MINPDASDEEVIKYCLGHLLMSIIKRQDAPASAGTHEDMVIDILHQRATKYGWTTTDPEKLDQIKYSVEHMDFYRKYIPKNDTLHKI